MREIKVRGKRKDNAEWVYGYYVELFDINKNEKIHRIYTGIAEKDGAEWYPIYYEVIPETVGQYTGLKDKNGTEIYEGDIVKIPDDDNVYGMNAGEIYEVYFAYGGFRLKPKYKSSAKGYWLEDDNELEVIGNIHDNPELIK